LVSGGWQWVDGIWYEEGKVPRYGDWSWWFPSYPTNADVI